MHERSSAACPEFGKSSVKAKQLQAGGNYQHSLS